MTTLVPVDASNEASVITLLERAAGWLAEAVHRGEPTAVYLDHRWATYQRDCDECIRRAHLDELLAEGEAEIWAQAHVDAALSVARLAPVAPVIAFPSQRVPGSES